MFWEPQRMWKGATVAIIGGGPSLTKADVEFARCWGCRTIGVNDAYLFGVSIDICFWGDRRWYFGSPETGHTGHRERVQAWPGIRATCCMDCQDESGVHTLIRDMSPGLHAPPRIKWYANSGWTAVGLAALLGADRIVLLGFDGRSVDGQFNWHPDNVSKVDDTVFNYHRSSGRELANDIQNWPSSRRTIVWNCTPDSAYDAFPCAALREVLV